jgi:hypothetical protein
MAPLRTAATTAALRRATQRFVPGDGKSIEVGLLRGNVSPPLKSLVFGSHASPETEPKYWRHLEIPTNDPQQGGDGKRSAPRSMSPVDPSFSQSLVKEVVSKKLARAESFFVNSGTGSQIAQ